MKKSLFASILAFAAVGAFSTSAFAGQPTDDAKLHFQAIGSGDIPVLMRGYANNAHFNWVGGPLDGTYNGAENIRSVWEKFIKAVGTSKVSVDNLEESANPKGATVTANVQFRGQATD